MCVQRADWTSDHWQVKALNAGNRLDECSLSLSRPRRATLRKLVKSLSSQLYRRRSAQREKDRDQEKLLNRMTQEGVPTKLRTHRSEEFADRVVCNFFPLPSPRPSLNNDNDLVLNDAPVGGHRFLVTP